MGSIPGWGSHISYQVAKKIDGGQCLQNSEGKQYLTWKSRQIINRVKIFSDMQELENCMPQEQTFTQEANARHAPTKQGSNPKKKKGGQGV